MFIYQFFYDIIAKKSQMVHKKYIKRDGKLYGPYYYESYREGNKVKTRYISSDEFRSKNSLNNIIGGRRIKTFIYLFAALGIAFALIYLFMNFQGLSGRVVLDVENGVEGSPLSGVLKFNLKSGELIPTEAKVIVNLGDFSKEFSLSELVKDDSISVQSGNFFAEGFSIEGSGEGFGAIGAKTIYPNVNFELRVFDSDESENIVNESDSEITNPEDNASEDDDSSANNESVPSDEDNTGDSSGDRRDREEREERRKERREKGRKRR